MGRHVASLGHIILIPSQTIFTPSFSAACFLVEMQQIVFRLNRSGSYSRSTTLEAITQAITPSMRLIKIYSNMTLKNDFK
jgi:hypothetical protein